MAGAIEEIERTAEALRREGRRLLDETGLLALLSAYGRPHPTGSFVLDLMAWRDLDIELVAEALTVERFFDLGREIATRLKPARMSFRDERIMETPGLPNGLYWGIYLPEPEAWKIDLWAVDQAEQDRRSPYAAWVQNALTAESRRTILEIKSAVWNDPGYRRAYSSKDIYDAVLSEGVADLTGFLGYLRSKGLWRAP